MVSFYHSLKDANGVLLIDGLATTTIAGHVAMAFELPVGRGWIRWGCGRGLEGFEADWRPETGII